MFHISRARLAADARAIAALGGPLLGNNLSISGMSFADTFMAGQLGARDLAGLLRTRGGGSNRCLEVPNSATTDGAQTAIWDCNGGANQSWTYTSARQLMVIPTAPGSVRVLAGSRGACFSEEW